MTRRMSASLLDDLLKYLEKRPRKTATREEIRLAFINDDIPDSIMDNTLTVLINGGAIDIESYKINPKWEANHVR